MMNPNEDDFAVRDENGAVVATLWCEMVGEATFDVYCSSCGDYSGLIAHYAMGFGLTCTGITRRFTCPGCGTGFDLPCAVELKEEPDYE